MNKKNIIIPLLLCAPIYAQAASNLSYSFVELDYINLDIDGYDDDEKLIDDINDGDGFGIRGSIGFAENFFAFTAYSSTQADVDVTDEFNQRFNGDTDINRFELGLGYHMPLSDWTDLVFSGAYTDIDVGDFDFGQTGSNSVDDLNDDSSDGYYLDVALRSQVFEWMEGSAGLRYTDIQSVDNVSFNGTLLFELSPEFGINVGVDLGDELTTYVIGARYSFNLTQR